VVVHYLKFFSNLIGIAVSYDRILKTTDGGENWFQYSANMPSSNTPASYFLSPNVGWCIGARSIYKTTDGGLNWISQVTGSYNLYSIFMLNENIGWSGGNYGSFYRTTNGGVNWISDPNGSNLLYKEVFFINSNLGWLIGSSGGYYLYQSNDGGQNWVQQNPYPTSSTFNRVYFTSETQGWLCGSKLWNTSNSGNIWNEVSTPQATGLNDIWSSDPQNVWAVGPSGYIISNAKRVYLTTPNGGNTWQMGSNQTITWKQFNISNIKIELSTNDGTSWTVLSASVPANQNSYNFTVPNTPSADCRIRISDVSNPATNDVSDSKFTIQGIVIQSPIGSEIWDVGTQHNISWISAGVTNLKIEYTTNNGTNWTVINSSVSASNGTYIWTINETPSNSCKVRLVSLENQNIISTSNNLFVIRGIKIIAPNGGENWIIGTQKTITWSIGGIDQVKIELSTNDGISWSVLTASVPASPSTYDFTVPNTPSTDCRIRISDVGTSGINDVSDFKFTLQGIVIQSPIGSEIWDISSSQSISWISAGVTNLKIEYTTNNGTNWLVINPSVVAANGIHNWTIPETPSNSCKVRLTSLENQSIISVSNDLFVIKGIKITSPNGGEEWIIGTQKDITWFSGGIDQVKIEYTTQNNINWTLIEATIPANNGIYSWTIPGPPSTQCRVRITDINNSLFSDFSEAIFRISEAPAITVTSPTSGELWIAGRQDTISWSSINVPGNINIKLSTDNGSSFTVLQTNIPNDGIEVITVPNSPSQNCKIRIESYNDPTIQGENDGNFTIVAPLITVNSPNGGEIYLVGTEHSITWTTQYVDKVKIEFSINAGSDWILIADSVDAISGSYNWMVPDNQSTNCKVKISDINSLAFFDLSNSVFRIGAPSVRVTSPNGGEVYHSGTTQAIEWISDLIDAVKIEYTSDNGGSWILVDSAVVSTGSYNWLIPHISSAQCRVRIMDILDELIYDISDSVFYIDPVGIDDLVNSIPTEFALYQNFPNPFNPVTRIYYAVPKESQVTIKLFNMLGEEIQTLVNEMKSTGNYWVDLDGKQLQSGIYIYQINTEKFKQAKKMILLK
jgi:photosystem II stability/assembly factor-like uncharacterized protein